MHFPHAKWLILGGLALVAGASGAAIWGLARSPQASEWVLGLDVDPNAIVPRARKNDRLPLPDPYAARHRDAEEVRRLGRPSVDAVWNLRTTLTPFADLAERAPPAPPPAMVERIEPEAPLAYAAASAADQPARDPFRIIDDGAGAPAQPPAALIPVPPPRPAPQQAQAEEDEEDEEVAEAAPIPIPPPRPRFAPPMVATGAPVALLPASLVGRAPPVEPARPTPVEAPRLQLASLSTAPTAREADPSVPRRGPTIMTPFGVPFTLQHDSVDTACFPPQLVELLRRIEERTRHKPVVTSGQRSRGRSGSLHRRCMAADIMVPGYSSADLAVLARSIPGMGGVGQYCHPTLVHIDIGTARDWKYGCGSFFALREEGASGPARLANRQ